MAQVIQITDPAALEQAGRVLASGGLVAFPTDTVYGVGSLPAREGVAAIYRAKGRPLTKPIPLLLASPELLERYAPDTPPAALALARRCWPGALTMVLRGLPKVAEALGSRDGTIGIRVPDHAELRELIALSGGALAITSANRSGGPDSVTAEEVEGQIGDGVELILDGGRCSGGTPSTVVNLTTDPPKIVRSGPLDAVVAQLLEAAGEGWR